MRAVSVDFNDGLKDRGPINQLRQIYFIILSVKTGHGVITGGSFTGVKATLV